MSAVSLADKLPEVGLEIFTSASAIVGIRGSGKTNDGVVLAEQAIMNGVPVVVVDPTGVWWGLKSSRDGKHAGLPVYIFGGAHADVPLDANAGPIIAEFVVDERVPIILDLSDLTKGQQRKLVGEFLESLYHLKARNRDPLLVILDEVPRFCPQMTRGPDPALAKCIGAVEDVVALGRSRGLGCAIIGQRAATINKNILTQADNLFAMRSVGPQDRKAIDEWVTEAQGDQAQRDQLVRDLAALPQGEGYFWSPALFGVFRRVKFAARSTFDSSRTPKIGETVVTPTAFAEVNLDALRGQIADAVEKVKADDPKTLRALIASLEKQLRERPKAEPTVIEKPVFEADDLATVRAYTESLKHVAAAALDAAARLGKSLEAATAAPKVGETRVIVPVERPPIPPPLTVPRATESRPVQAIERDVTATLGGGPIKILRALAGTPNGRASRNQLGFLSGYTSSGGSFQRYMSTLRTEGLIEGDGSTVLITEKGTEVAGRVPAVTTSEVLGMWRSKLRAGSLKMFDLLVAAWPEGFTRAEIAERTGYEVSGGSFQRYLSTLSGLSIIERRGAMIVASDALFPTGGE